MSNLKKDYGAIAIKEANEVEKHIETAFQHAVKCGEALIKKKEEVGHGNFIPWIEENMPISRMQCNNYIRLSENMPLLNVNRALHLQDLSIKAALAEIDRIKADEKLAKEKSDFEAFKETPEYKQQEENRKKKEQQKKDFDNEVNMERMREKSEKVKEQFKKGFYESLGITIEKGDPYYKLAVIILSIGNENLDKAIFKTLKHFAHPDKGGNEETFKEICKLEKEICEQ